MSRPSASGGTASSGIPALDDAFGGIYWGDNVVWAVEEGASAAPFYGAIGATASSYEQAVFVTVGREPGELAQAFRGFDVVDARPGTPIHQPGALLEAIRRRAAPGRRD